MKFNEWIYFGVEYPHFDELVILTDGQKVGVGCLAKDGKTKYWKTNQDLRGVIAWMPLPEPPNE